MVFWMIRYSMKLIFFVYNNAILTKIFNILW